jgi:hypothetical protein
MAGKHVFITYLWINNENPLPETPETLAAVSFILSGAPERENDGRTRRGR